MSNLKCGLSISTNKKSIKSSFLLELEKKYGIRIGEQILVCEDRVFNPNGLPDSLIYKWGCIPPNDCIERSIDFLNIKENEINSLNDIYELSKSGFYSGKHEINKNWSKIRDENISKGVGLFEIQIKYFKNLIPVILIEMKGKTISFRVDNPNIREMFHVIENILNNYTDYSEDDKDEVIFRDETLFKEQVEYLNNIF